MWIKGGLACVSLVFLSKAEELLLTFGCVCTLGVFSWVLNLRSPGGLLQAKPGFLTDCNFIFVANPQTHAPFHNSALRGP